MKTAYQKPTLVVVKIKAKYHMMTGSEKLTVGSGYNSSTDQVLSRRRRNDSFWDDEE